MNTRVETLRFGDAQVRVAAVREPGSEETGLGDRARVKATDALEAAQESIEAVAASAQRTISRLRDAGTCPASVELELGLAFTVEGNVIVAGGSVAASIVVHLTYDTGQ